MSKTKILSFGTLIIVLILFLMFGTTNNKKDMNLSKADQTKSCDGFVVPEVGCVINVGTNYDALGKFYYEQTNTEYPNYWQGAKEKCSNLNMVLPSIKILSIIYNYKGKIDGVPDAGAYLSSDEYDNYNANYLYFGGDKTFVYYHFKGNQTSILCVEK